MDELGVVKRESRKLSPDIDIRRECLLKCLIMYLHVRCKLSDQRIPVERLAPSVKLSLIHFLVYLHRFVEESVEEEPIEEHAVEETTDEPVTVKPTAEAMKGGARVWRQQGRKLPRDPQSRAGAPPKAEQMGLKTPSVEQAELKTIMAE
ncbi:hypothetical protein ROHU_012449 [Labeo rohita]|uniref:Uncharacterized protein n=1 Tax=Labeo rohita TaxID=84645 RepID=A0A498LD38_LABRO|nr:hypothetical protein ROHU_012449 [Labeo rohita]